MSEHEGHRARLRESFIETGIEGMADHQVLELLLTYALPRVDVNPLAHRLLDRFGSLEGVLSAKPDQLQQVKGIGDGGNEIGMGNLMDGIARRLDRIPCAVKADRLIIATVSNWGALGLCAALGRLPGEAELLAAYALCPQTGLIDGITGEPILSEDGFPIDYVQRLRDDLERWT